MIIHTVAGLRNKRRRVERQLESAGLVLTALRVALRCIFSMRKTDHVDVVKRPPC